LLVGLFAGIMAADYFFIPIFKMSVKKPNGIKMHKDLLENFKK
jgi:hypothetical protein